MAKYANADSDAQRNIEKALFKIISEKLGVTDLVSNKPKSFPGMSDIQIVPDFFSESAGIIGEIHSHIGKLKPAQQHKVAADILKMLLYEKATGRELQKIIVVCSKDEYDQLFSGKSHLACAIKAFNVKVEYIPLSTEQSQILFDSMKKQDYYTAHSDA